MQIRRQSIKRVMFVRGTVQFYKQVKHDGKSVHTPQNQL